MKGTRELNGQLTPTKSEDDVRTFTLSFSSEEPVRRWFGDEILAHDEASVNLDRLRNLGTVLYNHDKNAVVGRITKAWVANGRGQAEIEFDTDEFSEKIRQKVRSGSLKGVSVGYIVNRFEELYPEQTSKDGRFKGPASIAREWTPYEISIVAIPADPTVGVGRDLDSVLDSPRAQYETMARMLRYNENLQRR